MPHLSKFIIGFALILQLSGPSALAQCIGEPFDIVAAYKQLEHSEASVKVKHFKVTGKIDKELRASLDKNGPIDVYGKRVDALTKWLITWHWPGAETGNPDFSKSKPALDLSVIIPCWLEFNKAAPTLQRRWVKFVNALVEHEKGHIAIARENFELPAKAVQQAAHDPTLTARSANRIAQVELEKIRQLDIKYDKETEHGKKFGVKFP